MEETPSRSSGSSLEVPGERDSKGSRRVRMGSSRRSPHRPMSTRPGSDRSKSVSPQPEFRRAEPEFKRVEPAPIIEKAEVVEKPIEKNAAEKLQSQVNDVVDIMHQNIMRVQEREGKLSDLKERAEHMEEGTKLLGKCGKKLMEKERAKNRRMKIYCIVISVIALVLFFGVGGYFIFRH